MRNEYAFSDARPNPYSKRLKKPITIRVDEDAPGIVATSSPCDTFASLLGEVPDVEFLVQSD